MDIENFQLSYDISNGTNNPGNVKMIAADLTTAGACSPVACAATQIRKVNIALSGRNRTLGNNPRTLPLRNTLAIAGCAARHGVRGPISAAEVEERPLESSDMRKHLRNDESGMALMTVLLVCMLASALMAGMFAAISSDQRSPRSRPRPEPVLLGRTCRP